MRVFGLPVSPDVHPRRRSPPRRPSSRSRAAQEETPALAGVSAVANCRGRAPRGTAPQGGAALGVPRALAGRAGAPERRVPEAPPAQVASGGGVAQRTASATARARPVAARRGVGGSRANVVSHCSLLTVGTPAESTSIRHSSRQSCQPLLLYRLAAERQANSAHHSAAAPVSGPSHSNGPEGKAEQGLRHDPARQHKGAGRSSRRPCGVVRETLSGWARCAGSARLSKAPLRSCRRCRWAAPRRRWRIVRADCRARPRSP